MSYLKYSRDDELCHHGIKGQKWGFRRFQNKDGSLTGAGKQRYNDDASQDFKQYAKYHKQHYYGNGNKVRDSGEKKADEYTEILWSNPSIKNKVKELKKRLDETEDVSDKYLSSDSEMYKSQFQKYKQDELSRIKNDSEMKDFLAEAEYGFDHYEWGNKESPYYREALKAYKADPDTKRINELRRELGKELTGNFGDKTYVKFTIGEEKYKDVATDFVDKLIYELDYNIRK